MSGSRDLKGMEDRNMDTGEGLYSVEVPFTSSPNAGPIHRQPLGLPPMLGYYGCFTLHELFNRSCILYQDVPFLGYRPLSSTTTGGKSPNGENMLGQTAGPYIWETYGEAKKRIDNLMSGFLYEKLIPANSDSLKLVGIYLKNMPEWVITEYATYACGAATVPLYDTLGPETLEYICSQTELPLIVCSPKEVMNVVNVKKDPSKCPNLKVSPIFLYIDR